MKKFFIITLLLVSNLILAQSQKIESNKSNAEIFSTKSGTLIEKQFIDVGSSKKIKLQIVKYTDIISGDSVSASLIESSSKNQYSAGTNVILDIDELKGLIKSIEIINVEVLNTIPENYTEITFSSRGNLKAGCFWYKNAWSIYIQLNKRDYKSSIKLNKEELSEILNLLKQSYNKL
ncbi:hypothetical protein [Aquimarina sp. AU474]|uniref:hypothetical protein n=1 Tax=Aquimarina sp. AU474 TaxID=2108529 RepID=UPI000D687ED7|nr:hypothetical protein [Aquimarina sp. AU474]